MILAAVAVDLLSGARNRLLGCGRRARALWSDWVHLGLLGAQIIVLALTPSSYRNGRPRQTILRHIYLAMAPLLTWFLVLSTLVSLVLIRIVVATAVSYGLSQYALEVLVRTLLLELIPLYAAVFVALRYSMPAAHTLREELTKRQESGGLLGSEQQLLQSQLLPRALASALSVPLLVAISCLVALVLSYLTVHGLSPWGLPAYTRSVGQVFSPAVTLIFALKTLFFSLAVAIVPIAASARRDADGHYRRGSDLAEFSRLFAVLLLIEIVSLLGNYY